MALLNPYLNFRGQAREAMEFYRSVLGGELTRIAVSRADPVGEKTGWRPAMPVTQWAWIKP